MSARLLGAKPLEHADYPVFEIMGIPDCGKKLVAELVAKRVGGFCLHLPRFDLDSFTGRALIHAITQAPLALEAQPHWWAHMYAANMHEALNAIKDLRRYGPVVITNYVNAFRTWMRVAGFYGTMDDYFGPLPMPLHTWCLVGAHWDTVENIPLSFSKPFTDKLNKAMIYQTAKTVTTVKVPEDKTSNLWISMNTTAIAVTDDIHARYNIYIDDSQLYDSRLVAKKIKK